MTNEQGRCGTCEYATNWQTEIGAITGDPLKVGICTQVLIMNIYDEQVAPVVFRGSGEKCRLYVRRQAE